MAGRENRSGVASLTLVEEAFRSSRPDAFDRTLHLTRTREALRMMDSDQLKAFRLADEPADLRRSYGDTPLGAGCLLARRLVEVGVRAVEVTLDGRDHWPTGFSALVGGGGIPAGRVIGATDPEGRSVEPEAPVQVGDLHATVLDALGIDLAREVR